MLTDLISAAIAWSAFYYFRKVKIENTVPAVDEKYYLGVILIPLFWLALYKLAGTYKNIYRKSRLKELGQTLLLSFLGVLFIFFSLLLDDEVISYKQYYETFVALLSFPHLFICYIHIFLDTHSLMKRIFHSCHFG